MKELSKDSLDHLDPKATAECNRGEIEHMSKSNVSMMLSGLLNTLKENELLDLMAFLLSLSKIVPPTRAVLGDDDFDSALCAAT